MNHIGLWLALEVLRGTTPAARPSVMVAGLSAKGGVQQDTAVLISESVVAQLQASRRFERVLSQSDVQAALGMEQTRQLMSCESASCATEIANSSGTDFVLLGEAGKVGRLLVLNLRLLDVRRAQVVASVGRNVEGQDEGDLLLAVPGAVKELLEAMDRPASAPAATSPPPGAAPPASEGPSDPAPAASKRRARKPGADAWKDAPSSEPARRWALWLTPVLIAAQLGVPVAMIAFALAVAATGGTVGVLFGTDASSVNRNPAGALATFALLSGAACGPVIGVAAGVTSLGVLATQLLVQQLLPAPVDRMDWVSVAAMAVVPGLMVLAPLLSIVSCGAFVLAAPVGSPGVVFTLCGLAFGGLVCGASNCVCGVTQLVGAGARGAQVFVQRKSADALEEDAASDPENPDDG